MKSPVIHIAAVLGVVVLAIHTPLVAQVPIASGVVSDGDDGGELSLSEVEGALASMEASAGVESTVKDLLRAKYQKAIAALKLAADSESKAKSFEAAVTGAAKSASAVRAETLALPEAEGFDEADFPGTGAELQKIAEAQRAALAGLKKELAGSEASLALVKSRPGAISLRLPAVRQELAAIHTRLEEGGASADAPSPGQLADRVLLRARKQELHSELEMLLQEQLSQAGREDLSLAAANLLRRRVQNSIAVLESMEGLVNRRLASEARQVVSEADSGPGDIDENDAAALALAEEVRSLAAEFERVVGQLKEVSAAEGRLSRRVENLTATFDGIRGQMDLGGGGVVMARILFELRGELPGIHELEVGLKDWEGQLNASYLAAFAVDAKIRNQPEFESGFSDRPPEAVKGLLSSRNEVLARLRRQYGNLIRIEAVLLGDGREYIDKVVEVRGFLEEQLFWMKSSPPLGMESLTKTAEGFKWLNRPEHWKEFRDSLWKVMQSQRFASVVVILGVVVLLLLKRRIKSFVRKSGEETRRVSSDRYVLTLNALFGSVLLALPVPLLLYAIGWGLELVPAPSSWLRGMGQGLRLAGWSTLILGFTSVICMRGGLGSVHFGWPEGPLALIRRGVRWMLLGYVPPLVITASALYGDASRYFDSAGRVCFVVSLLVMSYVYWRVFRFSDGIFSVQIREKTKGGLVRFRYVWFSLAVWFPLSLVVLGAAGYIFTAVELGVGAMSASAVVLVGVVLYCVVLRWFMVKERKIALAEALERRRARQEAANSEEEDADSGEVVTLEAVDERMALKSISEQTRHLLQFVFAVGVFLVIGALWSRFLPVSAVLGSVKVAGDLSLLVIGKAVLIVVVTAMAGYNLPGLLELAVLRATSLDSGTRSAVSTLFQYVVYAAGMAMLFGVLNLDWSKFGWIAAALSVGLGFGLQEVVANFVCGLILLFECPIRVGDVVTVEGISGTVTRIRMRATTIVNWDRQEFVVPNKNIITGTFLNWTLSNQVSRLLITVGVAYGTDTDRARQILLDVAADSPLVVDDPAAMATFEEFGDSSLTLRLRAYLPNIDNRIRALSELHTEIDKRFKEAGIEISFPQRDLHLRSAGDWVSKVGRKERG